MKSSECLRNLFRQVLLNAGAKAKIGAVASEDDGLQAAPRRKLIEGHFQLGHHCPINDVGLGSSEANKGHPLLMLEFQPDFICSAHHFPVRSACAVQGAIS